MSAGTARTGRRGRRRRDRRGEVRQLLLQFGRTAVRAFGRRARAHQGLEPMAAVATGVLVDRHGEVLLPFRVTGRNDKAFEPRCRLATSSHEGARAWIATSSPATRGCFTRSS